MYQSINKCHYYVVDVIRIAAACLVVLFHFAAFKNTATDAVVFPFLSSFTGVGDIGVEIFFVISGLVIAMSAENARGLQGAIKFIRLRALRILPALWISTLIGFAVLLLSGEGLPSLLLTLAKSAMLSPIGPYIDGVVWSLVVEAVFYITVGLTIIAVPRVTLEMLAKAICAASTVYLIVWTTAMFTDQQLFELLSRFPSKVFLLRYGVFFVLGMLLWSSLSGHRSASISWTMLLAAVMCLVEIFICRWTLSGAGPAAAAIWCAATAAMVIGVIYAPAIERWLNARQRKTARYLGNLSYPLYLNHYTFGGTLLQLLVNVFHPISPLSLVLVLAVLTGAVLAMAAFVTSAERIIARRFKMAPPKATVIKPPALGDCCLPPRDRAESSDRAELIRISNGT